MFKSYPLCSHQCHCLRGLKNPMFYFSLWKFQVGIQKIKSLVLDLLLFQGGQTVPCHLCFSGLHFPSLWEKNGKGLSWDECAIPKEYFVEGTKIKIAQLHDWNCTRSLTQPFHFQEFYSNGIVTHYVKILYSRHAVILIYNSKPLEENQGVNCYGLLK